MSLTAVTLSLIVSVSCLSPRDTVDGQDGPTRCPRDGQAYLQILGSGGPMHAEGRGGSAYALWLSNRPAIVVDMGGDTPTALARAGAMPASVEALLISHVHADHVSGLADFLWGEMASDRRQPLAIAGPASNTEIFPSLPVFLDRLIGANGVFPTVRGLQDGAPFPLHVTTLSVDDRTPQRVFDQAGVAITALAVPHGAAPALAYRLEGPGVSVVLAGDQSGLHPQFAEFAADAGVLVFHAMVNERAVGQGLAGQVGIPSRLGELARASRARRVVLSHLMGEPGDSERAKRWSLSDLDGVVASVRRAYEGPIALATDLMCLPL